MKKLAAIYNIFDGEELLKYSVKSVAACDLFIFVYQTTSNFGERHDPLPGIMAAIAFGGVTNYELHEYIPDPSLGGGINETNKRNKGIRIAHKHECTHFLHLDCDEIYRYFPGMVDVYESSGKSGSACPILTYFKLPTLRFESQDSYYVPFIHELKRNTVAGHHAYPYYVDPTRRINCDDVVLLTEPMHHFSYVRRDIVRKCRNSSARANIEKSNILTDYAAACPGYYVKDFFGQKLIEVRNQFGIEI